MIITLYNKKKEQYEQERNCLDIEIFPNQIMIITKDNRVITYDRNIYTIEGVTLRDYERE